MEVYARILVIVYTYIYIYIYIIYIRTFTSELKRYHVIYSYIEGMVYVYMHDAIQYKIQLIQHKRHTIYL